MVLIVAALLWGFLFSARETGRRLRPAWWLDLHNYLGGLGLLFVGLHIVASMVDDRSGIGLVQALVPGTSDDGRWAIGWGVIASYLLAAAVFTSWPRRLANRRWWRGIHLTTTFGTGMALIHGFLAGTDAGAAWFVALLLAAVAVSIYAGGLRLMTVLEHRTRSRASA